MFSLMKKQFFTLVMMLAIVVLAGTSAMAQSNGLTVGTAIWHLPGSTHGLSVESGHSGTTFLWTVSSVACDGITAGAFTAPTFNGTSATTSQASFTYPADAKGIYRFLVTETATDGGCTTVREFFTSIMSIDVTAFASNEAGTAITGGDLARCNDYTLRRTETPATLVGNDNTDDNTNNLVAYIDPALFNERWVTVELSVSDNSGCATPPAGAPAANTFAWQFDYTVANGTLGNYVANYVGMDMTGKTDYTNDTPNSATGTIQVNKGVTSIIMDLRSNIRWGTTGTDADQEFTFTVNSGSTELDDDSAPYNYTDGTEPASEFANNDSAPQIVHASPATPRIIVND